MDLETELTDEQLLVLTTAELRRVIISWRKKNGMIQNISNATKGQLIPLVKSQYALSKLVPTFAMGELCKKRLQRDLLMSSKEVQIDDLVLKIPIPPPAKKYDYFKNVKQRKDARNLASVEDGEKGQSCNVPVIPD